MTLKDVLAALATVVNGLPQGLLALNYGFAAFPTALGFLPGIVGVLAFNQVAPISFQAESIVLAGTLGKDKTERLNIVFYTGVIMTIIGGLGLLEPTIDFIGPAILNGMMAGVGIILAKVGIDMLKTNWKVGIISFGSAVLTYFLTFDLVYTIIISVFLSSVIWILINRKNNSNEKQEEINLENEKFQLMNFKLNYNIVRSTLALVTLQIGGNIAYASITGNLANFETNVDLVTVYSGVGDALSAMFGGGPVEAIISGTAVAPNPKISGVLMMSIMVVILLSRVLPKVAKHVPNESIAGFLFVLGSIIVFPDNIALGLESNPVIAGITTIVTSATDPFLGMISGIITRFLLGGF